MEDVFHELVVLQNDAVLIQIQLLKDILSSIDQYKSQGDARNNCKHLLLSLFIYR